MAVKKLKAVTVQLDPDEYAVFSAICTLKDVAVRDVFSIAMKKYIDENKSILTDATERLNNLNAEAKK